MTYLERIVALGNVSDEEHLGILHQLAHDIRSYETHLLAADNERTTYILLEA